MNKISQRPFSAFLLTAGLVLSGQADASPTFTKLGLGSGPRAVVDGDAVYFVNESDVFNSTILRYDPLGGLTTFADVTNTGVQKFTSLSVDSGRAAFVGTGVNGLTTLGTWDGTTNFELANNLSSYPVSTIDGASVSGQPGDFSSLGAPHILGDDVVFRGGFWGFTSGGGIRFHEGIYTVDLGFNPNIREVVADIGTIAPGQTTTLNTFSYFANVFNGFGFSSDFTADQGGPIIDEQGNIVYVGFSPGSSQSRAYSVNADTGDQNLLGFFRRGSFDQWAIEDGIVTNGFGTLIDLEGNGLGSAFGDAGPFRSTSGAVAVDEGRTLFVGTEESGRSGIYLVENGSATELVSTDDLLDGRAPRVISAFSSAFKIGNESLDGDTFAFTVDLPHPTIANLFEQVVFSGTLGAPIGSDPTNPILPPDPSELPSAYDGVVLGPNDFAIPFTVGDSGLGIDSPVWIDPPSAIGYDYEILSGPTATSITLPEGFGDDVYEVYVFNELTDSFELLSEVDALVQLALPDGTTLFRVLGIEEEAGIDPEDPLGFPTGLTFDGPGEVALIQSAIVPEPTSLALMLIGCGSVMLRRRR